MKNHQSQETETRGGCCLHRFVRLHLSFPLLQCNETTGLASRDVRCRRMIGRNGQNLHPLARPILCRAVQNAVHHPNSERGRLSRNRLGKQIYVRPDIFSIVWTSEPGDPRSESDSRSIRRRTPETLRFGTGRLSTSSQIASRRSMPRSVGLRYANSSAVRAFRSWAIVSSERGVLTANDRSQWRRTNGTRYANSTRIRRPLRSAGSAESSGLCPPKTRK